MAGVVLCKCLVHLTATKCSSFVLAFLIISTFFFGILYGQFSLCLVSVSSTASLVSVLYCRSAFRAHLRLIEDDRLLMELPELYRYGRQRYWFSVKEFFIYMFDGAVQASISPFVSSSKR